MLRRDYQPPTYLVPQAHLEFDLGLEVTTVRSTLTLVRNPSAGVSQPLQLNGEGLEVLRVELDGATVAPERLVIASDGLTILDPPERCHLSVTTRLQPTGNTALVGLYATDGQLCTHCEPEGFRRITCFPDRPDVLTRFSVRLTGDCDQFPVLLANGNPTARGDCGDGRHWALWDDPFPKPCYLFAVVAGRFSRRTVDYRTTSGRTVALSVYAPEADLPRLGFALDSLQAAFAWDESHYGRECDLEVYNLATVADHNFGAMENKGLNIYSRASIVTTDGKYTTDDDYRLIALNIAHEYFHNWTGNRITCRDWFQLALKEGLTTYRTEQFEEEGFGHAGSRIALVRNLHTKLFAEESAATAHPVVPDDCAEVANLYNSTVYLKGAAIVRMLHLLIGNEAYRHACDLYFERFDGAAVTVEELLAVCEETSGRDLRQFRRWYYQAGTPVVTVRGRHDATAGTYQLEFTQALPQLDRFPPPEPLHMPIRIGLLDRNGGEMAVDGARGSAADGDILVELRELTQTVTLQGVSEPPIPSLLRDFSAPVKLEFPYTDTELLTLARCDRDNVNRWRALQLYYTRVVLGDGDIDAKSLQPLLDLLTGLLDDPGLDRMLASELLIVPLEKELAESVDVVDVDRICVRRDALRKVIARELKDAFVRHYEAPAATATYCFDAPSAAARRLRNLCLEYLVRTGEDEFVTLAERHVERATNMTDEVAAATALNQCGGAARERVFALLLERWRPEPLAVDKWFQLQGLDESPGATARIQALQRHPEFDMRRVSRVRALFAWFFIVNFRGFHDVTGAAYEQLVGVVQAVDRANSMAAAWMLRKSDLMRWKRFTSPRRELMQRALRQLASTEQLSTGTRDRAAEALSETCP